jgi:hypothetical protein
LCRVSFSQKFRNIFLSPCSDAPRFPSRLHASSLMFPTLRIYKRLFPVQYISVTTSSTYSKNESAEPNKAPRHRLAAFFGADGVICRCVAVVGWFVVLVGVRGLGGARVLDGFQLLKIFVVGTAVFIGAACAYM